MAGGTDEPQAGGVRIDRWLASARMFKSRTLATEACETGKVKLRGANAKPSQVVRVGDRLLVDCARGALSLEVAALGDKRSSPEVARTLYVDHTPPPPPKEEAFGERGRGAGRPTKRDRRVVDALRKQFSR